MANRFGMFYDKKTGKSYTSTNFSQEYIPLAHCNPKTPVHAKMYEQSREKIAKKRKKESEKAKKEAKKQWVENDCRHKNLRNSSHGNGLTPQSLFQWQLKRNLMTLTAHLTK